MYSVLVHLVLPPPAPLTEEYLLPLLNASIWRELGEAMSVSKDRLDEIFNVSETDQACLQKMINSDLPTDCNWMRVVAALRAIGEESLADEMEKRHVMPCEILLISTRTFDMRIHVFVFVAYSTHCGYAQVHYSIQPL